MAHHGERQPPAQTLSKVFDKAIRCQHSGVAISLAQELVVLEEASLPWYQVYDPVETCLNTGQHHLALWLLQVGIIPRSVQPTGRSVIHLAADQLALDVVMLLRSLGYDIKAVDENRNTLLHVVLQRRHEKERHKLYHVLPGFAPNEIAVDSLEPSELPSHRVFPQKSLSRGDTAGALVGISQNTDMSSWLEISPPMQFGLILFTESILMPTGPKLSKRDDLNTGKLVQNLVELLQCY